MHLCVVNHEGLIVNRLVADEGYDWEPPEGFSAVVEPEGTPYVIGGTIVGGVYSPPNIPVIPPPSFARSIVTIGIVRFTVTATVLTTTDDTIGVGGVTRVSAGRYRIFNAELDDNLMLLPSPTVRDPADIRARVSAKTSAYTEIKTVNAAGTATDAAEITVMLSKVI